MENEPLIECKSVWKIFGDRSDAAIRAVKERGIGKAEEAVEQAQVGLVEVCPFDLRAHLHDLDGVLPSGCGGGLVGARRARAARRDRPGPEHEGGGTEQQGSGRSRHLPPSAGGDAR